MPLLDMLQEIHFKLMNRIREKRKEMMDNNSQICPKIKKILDERINQSRKWRAAWDGESRYQVKYNTRFVTVDLDRRSCDCRVFDLTGIPCSHALAAIYNRRHQPNDYVSNFYKRDKYLASYSYPLQALKGVDYWEFYGEDVMLPPEIPKKLRGRPKRLRRKEEWEGGTQGKKGNTEEKVQRWSSKRVQHCSNCKKAGHRKPKCPDLQTGENDLSGGYESVTELNGENATHKSAGHTSAPKRKTLGLKKPKLQVRRSSITQDSQTNSASAVNMGQHVHAASLLGSLGGSAVYNNSDMHF